MTIVGDALKYPFRGNGKYILLVGAILLILTDIASFAPLIGMIAQLIMFGYFCSSYFAIIQTTSTGSDEAPQFPSASDPVDDIIMPALWVTGVVLLASAPAIAYFLIGSTPLTATAEFAMMAFFALYFPMAMLAVVNRGTLAAALPHVVVTSIFRACCIYWRSRCSSPSTSCTHGCPHRS